MKELYNSPAAIMLAFDKKDVIVCSPHDPQEKPGDGSSDNSSNPENGWSGLF